MSIIQRVPWTVQPQVATLPNAQFAPFILWNAGARQVVAKPQGTIAVLNDLGSDVWDVGAYGISRSVAVGSGGISVARATGVPTKFIAVIVYEVKTTPGATRVLLSGKTNFSQSNGFMIYASNANTLGINGGDSSGFPTVTITGAFSAGVSGVLALEFNGTAVTVFRNGARAGTATLTSAVGATTGGIGIGAYVPGGGNEACVGIRLFAAGIVLDGSGAELSRNPWQLFAPQTRRIWVPVSAGGGSTTVTATPANAAASGTTAAVVRVIGATPADAAATGVTAGVNRVIAAPPADAAATGVASAVVRVIAAIPADAAASGVTATIGTGGGVTISATPANATASGTQAALMRTIAAAPGGAAASGASAQVIRAIGATPANAAAAGATAAIQASIAIACIAANAAASGVAATITTSSAGTFTVESRARIGGTPAKSANVRIGNSAARNPSKRIGAFTP